MTGDHQPKGVFAHRQTMKTLWPGLCLSLLVLIVQSGCQESASATKAPQVEPPADSAAAVTQPKAEIVEPAAPQVSGKSPRITMEKVVHDFGEIGVDTKHTARFPFTSSGGSPLKIIQVKSCCGVGTRGVKDGQEYAPGQGGVLEVDYPAYSYPTPVKKVLYLVTNDPNQNVVALTLKGTVVRRVACQPERLRLFLRQENAGCGEIKLTSTDGKPFSVTGFRATANAMAAEFDPAVQATEFVLKPKADLEKLRRNLRGQISIDVAHPECKNVRLLFDVLPEFTVNPMNLMFFNMKANEPVKRDIWIISNYQDEFEIESVSSQKGTMKLLEQKKVGNRYQLQVEFTPPAPEGERAVLADVLEVKIKDGETLSIALRAFY